MSDDLAFLSATDRTRVLIYRNKAHSGNLLLIAFGVVVTIVLGGGAVWLGV